MLKFIKEKEDVWEFLTCSSLPIFIYGMGNGAEKILSVMEQKKIAAAGFFASDEFVRGQAFLGYRVHSLAEIEEAVGEFIILLAFAAGYPSLIAQIESLASRHTLFAPDVPVVASSDESLFDYDYCRAHERELDAVYNLLADEKSREVFSDIINFKISGKISYLDHCTTPREEIYGELLKLGEDEVYLDLGAYDGDTVKEFLQASNGCYKEIYALEADKRNYKKLVQNVPQDENIHLLNAAAWNNNTVLSFKNKSGRQSALSNEGTPTPTFSVDSLTASATLIKLDIEGAEREALIGAAENLMANAPKLIAALYHRNEDIFSLPLLIHQLQPQYRFYLRHNAYIPAWETLLIAAK